MANIVLTTIIVLLTISTTCNGQATDPTFKISCTSNMALRTQQKALSLLTTIYSQFNENDHCEQWARGFGESNLFLSYGCLKFTPNPAATGDPCQGNYWVNPKTSQLIEIEAPSGNHYVLFSSKKFV